MLLVFSIIFSVPVVSQVESIGVGKSEGGEGEVGVGGKPNGRLR